MAPATTMTVAGMTDITVTDMTAVAAGHTVVARWAVVVAAGSGGDPAGRTYGCHARTGSRPWGDCVTLPDQ